MSLIFINPRSLIYLSVRSLDRSECPLRHFLSMINVLRRVHSVTVRRQIASMCANQYIDSVLLHFELRLVCEYCGEARMWNGGGPYYMRRLFCPSCFRVSVKFTYKHENVLRCCEMYRYRLEFSHGNEQHD
uniref:PlxyGVORF44 protein n=1 Tax=Plutella xylostella granulovirus TaxID=98383 RepID=A0A1B2CSF0_9BBAC|nr:PlxyGVORF44 protein [Plutella xylostella granulovirus]